MKFLFFTTYSNETLIEKTQLYCLKNNIEVVRINIEDLVPNNNNNFNISILDDEVKITINKREHLLSEFSLVWKRRISNNYLSSERVLGAYNSLIPKNITRKLMNEIYEVRDLILHFTRKLEIPIINDYKTVCLNKPFQSIIATEFGLKSPSITVSNTMSHINSFVKAKGAITKSIGGLGYMSDEKQIMSVGTIGVDSNYTETITDDIIFPSFLQEYIKSKYELKCLLIGEELFCVKQYNPDGEIPTKDIKEAISANQIKKEQYQLSENVENRIVKLCKYFNLEICTIDIICSSQDEYAFIEINPDGIIEYYGDFLDSSIHESIYKWLLKRESSITE